jgi:O-antigen ligase
MKKKDITLQTNNAKASKTIINFKKNNYSLIFAILYLLVHFITDFGGADVMGAQWLYAGLIDLSVICYFIYNKAIFSEAINRIFKLRFTLLYSFFVLWALGSYFYAINKTESLVCLGRLASTYLIFINLSILFYKQDAKRLFTILSYAITFILVIDSFYVLNYFIQNIGIVNMDQNILSLTGNQGNKNVMAASIMIKVPFCLYLIFNNENKNIKIAGLSSLFIGLTALFILNTRSIYVAILLITFLFILVTILYFRKDENKIRKIIIQISLYLIPLIASYFVSDLILRKALSQQDVVTGYGLFADRFKTINIKDNESSRIHLWGSAYDYFKKHPFLGAGYGNWKLASIPYEKKLANELFVPYHAHNDFIENAAELGFFGLIGYLGLFVLMFAFTIKAWVDKKFKEYRILISFSFFAICCYAIDALLNFPAERTAMQTMFTLSAALLFSPYFLILPDFTFNSVLKKIFPAFIKFFLLILIIPSIFIGYQVYESFTIQKRVMGEINSNPTYSIDSVEMMPNIPNLSTSTLPIKALKARYYLSNKQYPEAIKLLRESYNDNPYLHYNDFLLTSVYANQGKFDSTLKYAKIAFYNWPRASSYYKNMVFAAVNSKDTAELNNAFKTSIEFSNSALTYSEYIKGRFRMPGYSIIELNKLVDKALTLFPNDEELKNTKNIINDRVEMPKLGIFNTTSLQNKNVRNRFNF